jgi:hypothetical protein
LEHGIVVLHRSLLYHILLLPMLLGADIVQVVPASRFCYPTQINEARLSCGLHAGAIYQIALLFRAKPSHGVELEPIRKLLAGHRASGPAISDRNAENRRRGSRLL